MPSTSKPVSYTHLDVYKRQILRSGTGDFTFIFGNKAEGVLHQHQYVPVSYTHLDVYKRQGWNGSGKRISIKDTRGIIDAILDGSIEMCIRDRREIHQRN